jgi:4-hydroxybutyrate CoA-transferase
VDLTGQINAESLGLKQISGVGGQADFVRGSHLSQGGKAITALTSTASGGKVSRIVPFLPPGSAVTTTRHEVQYVVTEYGIANLRGKSLKQRRKELIAVAHPDFREEIQKAYRDLAEGKN